MAIAPPTLPAGPTTLPYATPLAPPRATAYGWAIVAMLFVVGLLNYMDRLMISSMRDPIRADIHMSDSKYGLLMSVFLWVYAACSPLGGFLADRLGRRWVITLSLFFWSAATAMSGFSRTFNELLLARALMGVSEACYIPAALAMIADYHRGRTRSLATGVHMIGLYVGIVLGGLGGYIAESHGWRFGFKAFGIVGIFYGVLMVLILRDAPRVEVRTAGQSVERPPGLAEALQGLFSRQGFQMLFALNVLIGIVNWMIYSWLATFLKLRFGLTLGQAGIYSTLYVQIGSLIGVLLAGYWADRWSRTNSRARALVPAIVFMVAGPCLVVTGSTMMLPLALIGLVIVGLGRGAFDANHMPLLRELVNEKYSATGYGVLNFINTAIGGGMVYVGGVLMDRHIELAHVYKACGGALVLVGFILWLIRPGDDQSVA